MIEYYSEIKRLTILTRKTTPVGVAGGKGDLPFKKVAKLSILTRESGASIGVSSKHGSEPAPRTDRFYGEIKRLAKEVEGSRKKEGLS